ncbi:hypothetical protein D3C76_631850 [compost metagenome]
MKLAGSTSRVEASRPATSTLALAPKTMPLGLIRKMLPLASSAPWMLENLLLSTRFRVTESLPAAWTNFTSSLAGMSNSCQLMTAFLVAWLMMVCSAALWSMVAVPPATTPPVGPASAVWATAARETETVVIALRTDGFCFFLRDMMGIPLRVESRRIRSGNAPGRRRRSSCRCARRPAPRSRCGSPGCRWDGRGSRWRRRRGRRCRSDRSAGP